MKERSWTPLQVAMLVLMTALPARPAAAQEFVPPKSSRSSGTRIGLFGFGVRGGVDVRRSSQLVLGAALDMGDLFTNRVRLRPSGEIGVFNGPSTYVVNMETLWRFTEDDEIATPYMGLGFGVAGRENCGSDPNCPDLWFNMVFGFELRYRSTFNWLLEYHGMDRIRRNRLYIGFTTRRGN